MSRDPQTTKSDDARDYLSSDVWEAAGELARVVRYPYEPSQAAKQAIRDFAAAIIRQVRDEHGE